MASTQKFRNTKKGREATVFRTARKTLLDENDALATITWLYYHRKLAQGQIAQELGLSRPTIGRMLHQATDKGLVTVSLRVDVLRRMNMSSLLMEKFGLREVFIVPTSELDTDGDILHSVAKTGALYLESTLKPHQILAVAWGRTLLEVALSLRDTPIEGLVVAQSTGGLNSGEFFNPSRVTTLVGERLHARVYHLYVPSIVATRELRDVLLADQGIRGALDVARQASCFIASIGKVERNATVVQTGFLDSATLDRLKARGAIGDISSRYFDIQGKPVLSDIEDRLVGLSWDDLRHFQNVVVVVCGLDKIEAILGALRSGLIHVLIIDNRTALNLIKYLDAQALSQNGSTQL
jgi:DNA-binding transcriptional regulator LsrR (DeoR family)